MRGLIHLRRRCPTTRTTGSALGGFCAFISANSLCNLGDFCLFISAFSSVLSSQATSVPKRKLPLAGVTWSWAAADADLKLKWPDDPYGNARCAYILLWPPRRIRSCRSRRIHYFSYIRPPHALRRPKLKKLHLFPDGDIGAGSPTLREWKDNALVPAGVTPTPPAE